MASIHGTVSTIFAVQISAPCSPCMNWLRLQFWNSMPRFIHSLSPQLANGVWLRSMSPKLPSAMLSRATCSWSTSVSHGRSVSPFHMETLAFS